MDPAVVFAVGISVCATLVVIVAAVVVVLRRSGTSTSIASPSGPATTSTGIVPGPTGAFPASAYTVKSACVTYMADNHDDTYAPKCYDLVYDHCIAGYQDPSKIPPNIVQNMGSVLNQTWNSTSDKQGSFKGVKPTEFTRVCVANAATASQCTNSKAGAYRVHMPGYRSPGFTECDTKPNKGLVGTSYVKVHVDASGKLIPGMLGNVGK